MKAFVEMDKDELKLVLNDLEKDYDKIKKQNLSLNMARGKPDFDQLDASMDLLDVINSQSELVKKMDYRNYGILDGIDEAKTLFAEMLDGGGGGREIYYNHYLHLPLNRSNRVPFYNFGTLFYL